MGLLNIFQKNKENFKKNLTINIANRVAFIVTEGATKGTYQFGLNQDGIEIFKPLKLKPFVIINYDCIENIEVNLRDRTRFKNKSTVGRSIAGELIAGSLGAVIGGMSGTGSKAIEELALDIIIKIKDKNDIKIENHYLKGDNINKAKTFIKFLEYNLIDESELNNSKNVF